MFCCNSFLWCFLPSLFPNLKKNNISFQFNLVSTTSCKLWHQDIAMDLCYINRDVHLKTVSPIQCQIGASNYKFLLSCEITPETGAGDGAVRQARAVWDSLTAATAALVLMALLVLQQSCEITLQPWDVTQQLWDITQCLPQPSTLILKCLVPLPVCLKTNRLFGESSSSPSFATPIHLLWASIQSINETAYWQLKANS